MRQKAAPPNRTLITAVYIAASFLILWDIAMGSPQFNNWITLIGAAFLAIVGIIAIVRLFRSRSFRPLLIPVLLYFMYYSRLLEGRAVYAFHDCDFSICIYIDLKETGIWRYGHLSADDEGSSFGTFDVKNGTVYLYNDLSHLSLHSRTKLANAIHNGRIRYRYADNEARVGEWPPW